MRPFIKVDNQITLHLPHIDLADDIFRAVDSQRGYLREWLPWVDGTKTVKDTLAFINESIEKNKTGERLTTFIYNDVDLAGSISFVNFEKKQKMGEIGYWLHRDMQQQGIMTKTCQRFIDYAFRTKALNRIEVKVASQNLKSQVIPNRLGFTHEGTLREAFLMYGEFQDLELFSLLKREWTNQA
ncbi:MAG: ribosomal-protein-serine acetyltransferase [Paraglaciecola sp.]|jgi:ribosomal-protein-serine acetyltransferase